MTKITLPPIIQEIWGKVNKGRIAFRRFRKTIVLETDPSPSYTRTITQNAVRNLFKEAIKQWNKLTPEEKQQYDQIANKYNLTGYQYYIGQYIKNNYVAPGEVIDIAEITVIEQSGQDLTDYQLCLEINNDPDFFSKAGTDTTKLEIRAEDKTTLLDFYIEEWDTENNSAKIWIKFNSIPANGITKAYIVKNPYRTTPLSDPEKVFDFFDDFNGDALDTDKWSEVGTPSYSVANGILTLTTDTRGEGLKSILDHGKYVIELKEKWVSGTYFETAIATCYQDQSNVYATFASDYDDTFRLAKLINGSETKLATTTYAPVKGRWIILKLIVKDPSAGSFKAILDDEAGNHSELTGSDTSLTAGKVGIVAWSNKPETVDIDYFRVRKYTDPEPAIGYTLL